MRDVKLELIMVVFAFIFLFSLFDFTYCLITYTAITNQNSLSYRIFTMLLPIPLVISVIIKIIKWDETFGDILFSAYAPLFVGGLTMALALPVSLIFAAICNGILMLDIFL